MATQIDGDGDFSTPKGGFLGKLFNSCASDPRGSVHRAWGISLLFVVLYFCLAIIECELRSVCVVAVSLLASNFSSPDPDRVCFCDTWLLVFLNFDLLLDDSISICWRVPNQW